MSDDGNRDDADRTFRCGARELAILLALAVLVYRTIQSLSQ